jgi:hypothetical protein
MELTEEECKILKEMVFFAGLDFKNGLCILIKINKNRGKLKITQI